MAHYVGVMVNFWMYKYSGLTCNTSSKYHAGQRLISATLAGKRQIPACPKGGIWVNLSKESLVGRVDNKEQTCRLLKTSTRRGDIA